MRRTRGICSLPDCDSKHYARGWCFRHYGRWLRNGTTDTLIPTPAERFWAKVNKTDTCWFWTGRLNSVGYPTFKGDGFSYAHRWSYYTFVGPIPDGMHIDHKCHTPRCVNPDHLQAVPPRLNSENRRGPMNRSATGVRGVSFHKSSGKYRIYASGKYGGVYDTLEEAEKAVIALRNELMTNNLVDRRRGESAA